MRVEFEFDKRKAESLGLSLERITSIIKERFAASGLRCISEGSVLAFADCGRTEDFSSMWVLIDRLFNSGWYLQCASACRWYDEADENEEPEDVLSQSELLLDKNI